MDRTKFIRILGLGFLSFLTAFLLNSIMALVTDLWDLYGEPTRLPVYLISFGVFFLAGAIISLTLKLKTLKHEISMSLAVIIFYELILLFHNNMSFEYFAYLLTMPKQWYFMLGLTTLLISGMELGRRIAKRRKLKLTDSSEATSKSNRHEDQRPETSTVEEKPAVEKINEKEKRSSVSSEDRLSIHKTRMELIKGYSEAFSPWLIFIAAIVGSLLTYLGSKG